MLGDVAGKAISAALYMARLTSELRSRAAIARTPARLLRRVNQEVANPGDDGMFATLVYCIYDLEHRSLVFTNAGHCVPLLRRGDRVFPLQAERAHTPPIGVTPELEAGEGFDPGGHQGGHGLGDGPEQAGIGFEPVLVEVLVAHDARAEGELAREM